MKKFDAETADEVVAFDEGERWGAVANLLYTSVLEDKTRVEARPGLTGRQVYEVHALTNPRSWSAGEKALWKFVKALGRRTPFSPQDLASHFRGTETGIKIQAALMPLFLSERVS